VDPDEAWLALVAEPPFPPSGPARRALARRAQAELCEIDDALAAGALTPARLRELAARVNGGGPVGDEVLAPPRGFHKLVTDGRPDLAHLVDRDEPSAADGDESAAAAPAGADAPPPAERRGGGAEPAGPGPAHVRDRRAPLAAFAALCVAIVRACG
jgi:hypothetical protein